MNNNSFHIFYNPVSGGGKANKIIKKLHLDLEKYQKSFHIFKSHYPGHIKKLCEQTKGGNDLIIIGGDGTFNEAINGLMLNPKKHLFNVGFLPGGTGNSFLHDLNAKNYNKALKLIINGRIKKIDILKLNFKKHNEYSLNIIGWGLTSDINILAEKLRFLGSSRYILASIYYIFFKKNRKARIIIDGVSEESFFLFIMCLNTIHTGKGMMAAPKAKLDDGLLDLVMLKDNITIFQLLFLLPKIFSGEHIKSSKIIYKQVKSIHIIPDKNEPLNIDGENKLKTPVKISVMPSAINVYR